MIGERWMGLELGEWLAIAVAMLLVAGLLRWLFVERPRDRRRHG